MSDDRCRRAPAGTAIGPAAPDADAAGSCTGPGAAAWRLAVARALVIALVAGAGCGRESGPYASPRATLETLLSRARAGAKQELLACFTRESRDLLRDLERDAATLAAPVSAVLGPIDDVERRALERFGEETGELDVRREETDARAGRAALSVAFGDGPVQKLEFVREADGWKVDLTGELRPVRALLDSIGTLDGRARERLAEARGGLAGAAP